MNDRLARPFVNSERAAASIFLRFADTNVRLGVTVPGAAGEPNLLLVPSAYGSVRI
jgi:hypothetical protein